MPDYRAYIIGSDGHFFEAIPLDCADDAEAMEKAKRLADGRDVELWQRDRKVARFDHKQPKPGSNWTITSLTRLNKNGSVAMTEKSDRKELERRLEQARRMAREPVDPLTKERLAKLIRDLEEQLQ
jgi:hypothetical protein